jgi:spore maturation protein CgeB
MELSDGEIAQFAHSVTVIASHTAHKENILEALVRLMPELDLHIYGDRWTEWCRASLLKPHIQGIGIFGTTYAKAIRAARINLAITSWSGRPEIDETTTRSYEIPACGGFMLHERTPELLEIYDEDKEVACFGSLKELAEKIQYYLAHPQERESIARAGHARCVPAYSYDDRVRAILRYHESTAAIPTQLAMVAN